ncbi:voltage-dependent anion channel-domain-containing protein [Exophiala viscosa]|uniref:voltage-dependent anion channel-domain-containing protein n=1 Tax=Exophiala viscosa TaxID=2486360 RepID=UPI0021901718|nr:voltage-dependent anion channel-domain-containing protein [Exophiala viscosa]
MAATDDEDDREMQRLASNNPAMTMPASHTISRGDFDRLRSRSSTRVVSASNPAGAEETFIEKPSSPAATSKYEHGWRRVVRNFSPSWFSVTMGTGIVSLLLITIPFQADWLYWLSVIFFGLNTILFTLAFSTSVLRYTLYPEIWAVMIADPTNSLFLGTIPMGFATLVESWIFLCCPYWGYWSVTFAWVCWMIDAVVAAAVTVSLPFLLMSQNHQHSLDRITAAQLLPIAATIVAAGAGAEVAELITNPAHALGTLITSYVMWGMATPLAMTILVIYYQRLALHKLPPREIVVSSFLPLGPLGMGGYTIMYLGKVSREVFPRVEFFHNLTVAGDVVYVMGVFIALIMWGFGLCWFVFALATIYSTRDFPFNMGWWGFTFPLGVYAISTITFGVEMPSMFFKVLGTIFSVAVVILWCVVAVGTAKGARSGKLFYAPCLKNLPKDDQQPKRQEDELDKEKQPGS